MKISSLKENVNIDLAFGAALTILPTETNTIVSVGSGFGVTEKKLEEVYKKEIITIDPLWEEFRKPTDMMSAKMPMYDTVESFMKKTKPLSVTLMLDWPSPDKATYCVDSIVNLNPHVIIVRYASCGAAGSVRLQAFLGSCGCPFYTHCDDDDDYSDDDDYYDDVLIDVLRDNHEIKKFYGKYTCVYKDQHVNGTGRGYNGNTVDVVVLVRN